MSLDSVCTNYCTRLKDEAKLSCGFTSTTVDVGNSTKKRSSLTENPTSTWQRKATTKPH